MDKSVRTALIFLYLMIIYSIVLNIKTQNEVNQIRKDYSTLKVRLDTYDQRLSDVESFIGDDGLYE
jgi:hypothetical protein